MICLAIARQLLYSEVTCDFPPMEYQRSLVSTGGRENYIWNRMDVDESSSIGNLCAREQDQLLEDSKQSRSMCQFAFRNQALNVPLLQHRPTRVIADSSGFGEKVVLTPHLQLSRPSQLLEMMKLAILVFCVAAATAGIIPSPVESAAFNVEADMEAAATHHHGLYERNIGIYAGALPSVYPSYPEPYYPSYSPGYVPTGYGYPYRPYPSYGVGVFAG
ncbi:hypothetical protein OUZ56_026880 [Daphnia magna]|uniref:Uncharacterized protein n=2 Tax=Daphnia magna TaxID=35525 RepID=A0ABQ9ZN41_9CRUS|nr:hypothetical protein OUZ56_026880 [Daphnia magna]